MSKTVGQRR